ncbi:MAG TPA: undecaprenyl-diphosphate phosphatase [bacterium]|nr:undecaprenyl-diphosphate phosphatase [bacterium]
MFILYFKAIILAIVQGVTEVLPISSSAHLAVLHETLDFQLDNNLLFDIALHVGTALALAFLFLPKLKKLWQDKALWLKVILGIVPAAIIGFLIEDYVDKFSENLWVIGVALIFGALLFFGVEKYARPRSDDLSKIGKLDAFVVGCLQILSFIPGISRSGITIVAGMSRGLSRRLAAEFSFLLAIPLILGMGLKKIWDFWQGDLFLQSSDGYLMAIATVLSGVVAYFSAKYLLKFLEKYGLQFFAWYRIILGGSIILLSLL